MMTIITTFVGGYVFICASFFSQLSLLKPDDSLLALCANASFLFAILILLAGPVADFKVLVFDSWGADQ